MRINEILATVMIAAVWAGAISAQSQPERLYGAVIDEGSLSGKKMLSRQLGRLGTAEAKSYLLKLLEDSHYWNQQAAIEGLFLFDEPDIRRRLVREMMENHMVRSQISEGLRKRLGKFFGELAEALGQEKDARKREIILVEVAATDSYDGELFLKSVVADQASPDRRKAAGLLAKHFPNNYQYFSGLADDPEVRIEALGFLAERGSARDLPVFINIIEHGGEEAEMVIAYQAVAKWGDAALKERIYLDALSSDNEKLVRGAMAAFSTLYNPGISAKLGHLSRQAKEQRTRMMAGVRLAELGRSEVVPILVPLLDEQYQEPQSATFSAVASVMTAGIWTVLDGLSQSFNRKSFENSRASILAGLRRITGADAGDGYHSWKDWAILHGYIIKGENIVQQLFSSDRSRRRLAIAASLELLGYRDTGDFVARKKVATGELELTLALARELMEKRFIADEIEQP